MAAIGSIRKRGGIITIVIGVALAAFVLGDFWKKGNKNHKTTNIADISGEKITYLDFELKVEAQSDLMKQQSGKENLTADELYQLREETWKKMVRDIILGKEYNELGLFVSSDELWELVQGKEPHQYIIQNFTDPQTSQFNPSQVRSFLQNLDQYEEKKPGTKAQWESLEQAIKTDRIFTKYSNLIKGGIYYPKALAKLDYERNNKKAVVRFIVDRYSSIPDAKVSVTDDDILKYYNAHKHEYEQETSRDLDYVAFDVDPSEADLKKAAEDVAQIVADIEKQEDKDIPAFVNRYSDDRYDSSYFKKGSLPELLDTLVFKNKKGELIGPLFYDYTYTIAKVMDFQMRPDSMRASHILIAYAGALRAAETITRTKDQAKEIADSLLEVIKKTPKKFDTIAKTLSDDPSAKEKAGDLDWFVDGAMTGPFNETCVKEKVGEIKLVTTDFGYHIVKVTGKKKLENKARVAVITRKIEPSNETFQKIYAEASSFAGENTTAELFNKSVIAKKLNKKTADYLSPMSDAIAGLESPREIIRWAFEETSEKGNVSRVFDLQGSYVVACLKEVREKGIPTIEQIKTQIEPLAKRDKKAETIIKKIAGLKIAGITIEQLALKLDSAKVDTADALTFSTYSIPGYGPEPEIIGTIFTMKPATLSEPLKGKAGVFVTYIDKFIEAPATTDYSTNQKQLAYSFKNRISYELYNALEKSAKIVDNRPLFY